MHQHCATTSKYANAFPVAVRSSLNNPKLSPLKPSEGAQHITVSTYKYGHTKFKEGKRADSLSKCNL
jgi:hypothetical protein